MSKRVNKQRLIVAVLALGSSSAAYSLMYGPAAVVWVTGQIATLVATTTANIDAFGASFAVQMNTSSEQIISALAIATKAEAVAANDVADNNRRTASMVAEFMAAQSRSNQIIDATINHSGATGQGYDPCGTSLKNKTADMAFNNARVNAVSAMRTYDVGPGRLVPSTERAMADRLNNHRTHFCTESEDKAGVCTLSTLPGADTNAALVFESAAPNSLQKEARTAYIQNVLGAPDGRVSKAAGATPAGEEYLAVKNRKDALMSIPAYSLAMIDAANTQDPNADNKSANELLRLRVDQYFGGSEAQEWSSRMAMQNTRGLLVEANRMAGLEVWLHYKQYEQSQRINANVAALLIASAERVQPGVDRLYKAAMAASVSAIND